MIIVMEKNATPKDIENVCEVIKSAGLGVHISKGEDVTIIGVIGDRRKLAEKPIELMDGVEKTVPIMEPYKLASRTFHPEPSVIKVKDVEIGGNEVILMAGPCAVESREQLLETAEIVKKAGAKVLRGGAFKPRTSPYSFQGLGEKGLEILAEAREKTGLPIITEVVGTDTVDVVAEYTDIIQIGARNMQNFPLLKAVGRINKPVMLKRGLSATIEEWLNAAEYIMNEGNFNVILCERGIRTFETMTRNTLDLSSVPIVKHLSHLPVIVDPSHAAGNWRWVMPLARGAVAVGADGLIIEVHPNPKEALSDGPQSLNPENLMILSKELKQTAAISGRYFRDGN
ncbi:3-deoxy-7-phosphoheptulonate synthase [Biomaibacter acetigenes]|jgi:3-deoxy-7-phosphoheptulonate synthase|uniref:3-deoxy-7-phosphoheptulonate synthase n=1 Tax=Biomaibacter acetigenes TaxID=2316383 RepID=A0A3G2R6S0_9FIRM|nr:3-deoxy-7-phosphoheptulonate synthase [Biomaibacter acetigenes]AYO31254.1 3-deoxy-7-phosphoheptulonate synthase [Biomaibacter acetigenes]MDN5313570.1 3-deoxy-7-phosphoheptulonate synthase [Thermoanaerobacteraceae bacterium]RKL63976.1 3-deoxy-7-phosphoheptulonate synthase [Thermoanaerobacteraceae bacterium SP2]